MASGQWRQRDWVRMWREVLVVEQTARHSPRRISGHVMDRLVLPLLKVSDG
jgi:hypothetical protein